MSALDALPGAVDSLATSVANLDADTAQLVADMITVLARIPTAGRAVSDAVYTSARAVLIDNCQKIRYTRSQTGYVSTSGTSVGTGEDTRFLDVTIAAVSAIGNCELHFVGGAAGSSGNEMLANDGDQNSPTYKCTARLTSTTNLRIAAPANVAWFQGRWQVVDHGSTT